MTAPEDWEPTRAELQDQIDRLETQHAIDQELIDHLSAQGEIGRDRVANLEIALHSARRIGTAVGILMVRQQMTDEAAFSALRVASQRTRRKLRDVAEEVILTGTLD